MARKAEATIPPNAHPRTHAARTTTPETLTPRPAPTVKQVLAAQKPTETFDRAGNRHAIVAQSPAAPLPAVIDEFMPVPAGPRSEAAFERNLMHWGGVSDPALIPNLLEGDFRTTGGEVVDVKGIVYVAHIDEAQKRWLRFHGEGVQPTIIGVGIYEDAVLPSREELGDTDPSLWERDRFRNEPTDPWQQEFRIPIVSTGTGGEIYHLTSRSKTAEYATRGLIDRYGRHPQRKKGLVPLITLSIGTYPNRKTGRDAYKPVYQIVGWVQKDGSAPPTKPDLVSSGYPFNDEIPH